MLMDYNFSFKCACGHTSHPFPQFRVWATDPGWRMATSPCQLPSYIGWIQIKVLTTLLFFLLKFLVLNKRNLKNYFFPSKYFAKYVYDKSPTMKIPKWQCGKYFAW